MPLNWNQRQIVNALREGADLIERYSEDLEEAYEFIETNKADRHQIEAFEDDILLLEETVKDLEDKIEEQDRTINALETELETLENERPNNGG